MNNKFVPRAELQKLLDNPRLSEEFNQAKETVQEEAPKKIASPTNTDQDDYTADKKSPDNSEIYILNKHLSHLTQNLAPFKMTI